MRGALAVGPLADDLFCGFTKRMLQKSFKRGVGNLEFAFLELSKRNVTGINLNTCRDHYNQTLDSLTPKFGHINLCFNNHGANTNWMKSPLYLVEFPSKCQRKKGSVLFCGRNFW